VPNLIRQRLQAFQQQTRLQAGSLIVSVFGDAIHPRGGVVWLGCLIRLLEPLAINERLIRTAIFRLVKEEWLETHTLGRRTDYGLSATGRQRIDEASQLIYGGPKVPWDEQWRILLTPIVASGPSRVAIRKALHWQGFGEWNASTFLHPSAELGSVIERLHAEGLTEPGQWMTLMAQHIPTSATLDHHQVVEKAWDLQRLSQGYQAFLKQYEAMHLAMLHQADAADVFLLRILLVHDYRRLLLQDPNLPINLLPVDWPGLEARKLFNALYLSLHDISENYLDAQLITADGSTPPREKILSKRIAAMRVGSKS
jgi:phenylacetic acid degradation operon negative regulatory protein